MLYNSGLSAQASSDSSNGFSFFLYVASLVPGPLGGIANGVNAIYSFSQGDILGGSLSTGAALGAVINIPGLGAGVKAIEAARAIRAAEIVADAGSVLVKTEVPQIFERVLSDAELQAIQESGLLRGGRSGTNFFTDSASLDAKRAQQRLGLDGSLRDARIRFTIEDDVNVVGPAAAAPGTLGTAGGGREFYTTARTQIRILKISPLRR